jgi:hypothetical protein
MKKNLIITFLLLVFIINLIPINTFAYNEISQMSISNATISDTSIYFPDSEDTSFSFTLASNASKTRTIICDEDATITVGTVISSPTSRALVGIIDPDGTYHCASIKGYGTFTYTFPSDGSYKIYCKNTSSSSYSVSMNFAID